MKVGLLVSAATVWGAVAGMAAAQIDYPIWPSLLAVLVVVWLAMVTGRMGVCRPVERLVDEAKRITRPNDPLRPKNLPVNRRDEVGELARALMRMGQSAERTGREVRMLRRTLDDRVEKATKQATHELQQLAMRDAMTQLGNRRFLDTQLDNIVKSCQVSNTDLLCIAIDIDDFKKVNDTLGHKAGDDLIIFVGQLIRALIRETDYAVRIGGDEFIVLLPGASLERAATLCDQLGKLFVSHGRTLLTEENNLGLSMGVASLQQDCARTGPALIEAADAKLYVAKHGGKGQAVGL